MFANETVMLSPAFIFIVLEVFPSSPYVRVELSFDIIRNGGRSNATLCGPPETMLNLMPSPALIVMLAGS